MAAIRQARSSRRPRLPLGFVFASSALWAFAKEARSAGSIRRSVSARRSSAGGRAAQLDWLLERFPLERAGGTVAGDPLDHLLVTPLGGGEEGDRQAGGLGEPDGERGLTRAGSADQEDKPHVLASPTLDRSQ